MLAVWYGWCCLLVPGEGIHTAMMGGRAAAETLVDMRTTGDFSKASTAQYTRRWMKAFGHDFPMSTKFAELIYRCACVLTWMMHVCKACTGKVESFYRTLHVCGGEGGRQAAWSSAGHVCWCGMDTVVVEQQVMKVFGHDFPMSTKFAELMYRCVFAHEVTSSRFTSAVL